MGALFSDEESRLPGAPAGHGRRLLPCPRGWKVLATASYRSDEVFIHDVVTFSPQIVKLHTGA